MLPIHFSLALVCCCLFSVYFLRKVLPPKMLLPNFDLGFAFGSLAVFMYLLHYALVLFLLRRIVCVYICMFILYCILLI